MLQTEEQIIHTKMKLFSITSEWNICEIVVVVVRY